LFGVRPSILAITGTGRDGLGNRRCTAGVGQEPRPARIACRRKALSSNPRVIPGFGGVASAPCGSSCWQRRRRNSAALNRWPSARWPFGRSRHQVADSGTLRPWAQVDVENPWLRFQTPTPAVAPDGLQAKFKTSGPQNLGLVSPPPNINLSTSNSFPASNHYASRSAAMGAFAQPGATPDCAFGPDEIGITGMLIKSPGVPRSPGPVPIRAGPEPYLIAAA